MNAIYSHTRDAVNNKLIIGITPSKSLNWMYRKLDENPPIYSCRGRG